MFSRFQSGNLGISQDQGVVDFEVVKAFHDEHVLALSVDQKTRPVVMGSDGFVLETSCNYAKVLSRIDYYD